MRNIHRYFNGTDIRDYMLANEDVIILAAKMVKMNTVLPGERIIIFNDGSKKIVLEGNRRTCIYQMFLNRSLIPEKYKNSFPIPTETYIKEIEEIDLDVVSYGIIITKYILRH